MGKILLDHQQPMEGDNRELGAAVVDLTEEGLKWIGRDLARRHMRGIGRRLSNGDEFRRRRQLGQRGRMTGGSQIWMSSGSICYFRVKIGNYWKWTLFFLPISIWI